MSRDIKFRAWDARGLKGHMVKVHSLQFNDWVNVNGDVPLTLMQYTGLKDKNGVEIYEGDIVTTDHHETNLMADNWTVEYGHTGMYQLALGSFKTSIHELVYNKWKLEVIGNIYDNPELLK